MIDSITYSLSKLTRQKSEKGKKEMKIDLYKDQKVGTFQNSGIYKF